MTGQPAKETVCAGGMESGVCYKTVRGRGEAAARRLRYPAAARWGRQMGSGIALGAESGMR